MLGLYLALIAGTPLLASEFDVADDCSFVGLDLGAPSPTSQGSNILTSLVSIETFDGVPLPYSELTVFDCAASKGAKVSWDNSLRGEEVLANLQATNLSPKAWVSELMITQNAEEVSSGALYGTLSCGCELHYGIEVTQ